MTLDRNAQNAQLLREIHELVSACLVDKNSPEAAKSLQSLLIKHPDARRIYLNYMSDTTLLHRWAPSGPNQSLRENVDESVILQLLEEAEEQEQHEAIKQSALEAEAEAEAANRRLVLEHYAQAASRPSQQANSPYHPFYAAALAIAAGLLLAIYAFSPPRNVEIVSDDPPQTTTDPSSAIQVATLTDSVAAELISHLEEGGKTGASDVATDAATILSVGRYQLTDGVIHVRFDGGAEAILEAPASFIMESADRIQLLNGRLVGNVPQDAVGFTVKTPSATVIDLGTEFGVSVLKEGIAEVSVFDGQVEVVGAASADPSSVQPNSRLRQRLTADTSLRVEANGEFGVAQTGDNLYFRELPTKQELDQKIAYERWLKHSTQIAADPDAIVYYPFYDQEPSSTLLLNRAGEPTSMHGRLQGAQWDEGRWPQKQSLRLGGGVAGSRQNHVQVDISGEFSNVTACAWVNIDSSTDDSQGLFMSDGIEPDGRFHWQLLNNGRMQAGYYEMRKTAAPQIVSSASLFPSGLRKWSHLAVACETNPPRVTYYIDGMPAGSKRGDFHDKIVLGSARIGGWKPGGLDEHQGDYRTLHGRIDELVIFRRLLSKTEILEMYEAGVP